MREAIRDRHNKVLGYMEEMPNGDIQLRDFYMNVIGRYDKGMDVTRDFYGNIKFKGNQLSMLLGMNMK